MADHATHDESDELNLPHLVALLGGGITVGFGAVNLFWAFGWNGADQARNAPRIPMNTDTNGVGWSGLDNITLLASADYAIPLIVTGALVMVIANATAWRKTGGY
jgi:hypothetical protein